MVDEQQSNCAACAHRRRPIQNRTCAGGVNLTSLGTCDSCTSTAAVRCKCCGMRFCSSCRDDLACQICGSPTCGSCLTTSLDRASRRVRSCLKCARATCSSCKSGHAPHRCRGCGHRWCDTCAPPMVAGSVGRCDDCL